MCVYCRILSMLEFPQLGLIVGRKIFPCGVYPSYMSDTWPWYPSNLGPRTQNPTIERDYPSIMERGPPVMWSIHPSLHLLHCSRWLTNSVPSGLFKQIIHPWFSSPSNIYIYIYIYIQYIMSNKNTLKNTCFL